MSTLTLPALRQKVSKAAPVVVAVPNLVTQYRQKVTALKKENDDLSVAKAFIWGRLSHLGIYEDKDSHEILMSEDCQEKDARSAFCNGEPNLPAARYKRVWAILKETAPKKEEAESEDGILVKAIKGMRPIGQWSSAELIGLLGPDCDPKVIDELDKRAKERPFVVFEDEVQNIVDVETTARLLREARRRETPVHYKVGEILKSVFRAGEFPSGFFFECPFHGVLLFDGYCDECGYSWDSVDYEVRQLARMIHLRGEAPEKGANLRQFIHTAMQEGIDGLAEDYPKAGIEFKEAKEEGCLPVLKKRTSQKAKKSADPFGNSGNTRY